MIEVFSQNIESVWYGVACTQQQIIASSFSPSQKTTLSSLLTTIPYDTAFQVFHEPSAFAQNALASLKNIYDGKPVNENLSLAFAHLPTYTQKVLKATKQIPTGYVTSYGLIAKAVGGGPRAVGNIMATNPFAPIVPCHRVVKSDFSLGGYGGGLKVKTQFLLREKRGFSTSKKIPVNGSSLTVFPIEVCLSKLGLA